MSGGSIHLMDSIEIDDDGSQGLPTSVNIRSVPFTPQARGAECHCKTIHNKYLNLFSCMDEKSDIDK